jgi:thiamine pyrophosphokinase
VFCFSLFKDKELFVGVLLLFSNAWWKNILSLILAKYVPNQNSLFCSIIFPYFYPVKTIVLANGSFPRKQVLLDMLDTADRIICCDAAVHSLLQYGLQPTIIIGDLDSIDTNLKERFAGRLLHIADQDTNDLTKAVNWCVGQGIGELSILGATGKREDHTLGNIALLLQYAEKIRVQLHTDYGRFIPVRENEIELACSPAQQLSVFSLNPDTKITSEGLKYPLQAMQLKSWWQGTLNECTGNKVRLVFEGNPVQVLVYLVDEI